MEWKCELRQEFLSYFPSGGMPHAKKSEPHHLQKKQSIDGPLETMERGSIQVFYHMPRLGYQLAQNGCESQRYISHPSDQCLFSSRGRKCLSVKHDSWRIQGASHAVSFVSVWKCCFFSSFLVFSSSLPSLQPWSRGVFR